MPDDDNPEIQRRRLRIALREARLAAGLTQRQVTTGMDWSPSKLLRIEGGTTYISTIDLRALLGFYGVTDPDRVQRLVKMARLARRRIWEEYRGVLSAQFFRFLQYESSAAIMRHFEPLVVPGLLQTPEYCRAILRIHAEDLNEQAMERLLRSRLERQRLLHREDPPRFDFILDEAVLHRQVGSPNVMLQQLHSLRSASNLPHVQIRIIPFTAGAHVGLRGNFMILEFSDAADDNVLCTETSMGTMVATEFTASEPWSDPFLLVEKLTTSAVEAKGFLEDAIERFSRRRGRQAP